MLKFFSWFSPKRVIFITGALTVGAGSVDYLLDQEFVAQYAQVVAALVVTQNVLLGALKVIRVVSPVEIKRKPK